MVLLYREVTSYFNVTTDIIL